MNSRQRRKRGKRHEITIIVSCKGMYRAEYYEKMRKSIEYQLNTGNAIVLPTYLHLEAVIQQHGSRRIEVKTESEATA